MTLSVRRETRRFLTLLTLSGLLLAPHRGAKAQPPAADQATKDEARSHFEQGIAHFDREEWSAALAEFLRSREIFPTRAATKNAGTCLRKERRFDEALEMFEALVREFPDLSPADRAFADREISDLRASVGTLEVRCEPGASILVDGRSRGTVPLAQPLRVSVGTHVVRAYKEGFLPLETRIDVAGRSVTPLEIRLQALTRSGQLKVTESSGRTLDVVVDNATVGRSPWEGSIAVGEHVVTLRGGGMDASVGTQPVAAPVREGEVTTLSLVAEALEGQTRIVPSPAGAAVAIDGVAVGRGIWEGRLRVGRHRIEVAADGFLPSTRTVTLEAHRRSVVAIELERDRQSPLWAVKNPAVVFFEVDGALGLAPLFGGDVMDGCRGGCSSGLPLGGRAVGHGGYELGSGLGFGLDVGYLRVSTSATGRATLTRPTGLAPNVGTADDELRLSGVTLTASAMYHARGTDWPFTVRLGAGILLGSLADARTGKFTNSRGDVYPVAVSQTPAARYLVVAPEVRIGHRFGSHVELSAGVEIGVLVALGAPEWTPDATPVIARSPTGSGDGQATFGKESLAGSTLLALAPGVGLRYDF